MKAVPGQPFGAAYFRKFYINSASRVVTSAEMRLRANMMVAILAHAGVPIHRILDVGCGIGLLRKPLADVLPRAKYEGVETSDYLCRRYGWTRGSVRDFKPRATADLAICYDVLQYLDDRDAARALSNLARLTHAGLYFSALTAKDWRDNCDQSRTDRNVFLRSGDWYRKRLSRHFRSLGCGVWLHKNVHPYLWELERQP